MAFKWFKAEGNGSFIGKDEADNVFEIHPSRQAGGLHEGYFSEGPHGSWEGTPAQLKKIAVQALAEHKQAEKEWLAAHPHKPSRSSGTAKTLFWGGLAALGGVAAWKLTNEK